MRVKSKTTYHNLAVALRKLADHFQRQIDDQFALKDDVLLKFNYYSKEAKCLITIKHEEN